MSDSTQPIGAALATTLNAAYLVNMEYVSGNLVYLGRAAAGTLPTAAGWEIRMLTYSGTDLTAVTWAAGTSAFINVWSNRASYIYS